MHSTLRPLLVVAGTVSVGLAIVGMFIPILPTTPFLLLAAACYARSSERFLGWLLNNPWFGGYIRNYREGRGMPRLTKVLTLAALWVTLTLSALFGVTSLWARLLLLAVGIGVTIHLARIPTTMAAARAEKGAATGASPPKSEPT